MKINPVSWPDMKQVTGDARDNLIQTYLDWEQEREIEDLGHGELETEDTDWLWVRYGLASERETIECFTFLHGYRIAIIFESFRSRYSEDDFVLCEWIMSSLRIGDPGAVPA